MTYISTITDEIWGTVIEQAYIPADQDTADFLCTAGILIKYDETVEPRPARKVYTYVSGVSYPADSLIVKDGTLYTSNVITSTTWVLSEHTLA